MRCNQSVQGSLLLITRTSSLPWRFRPVGSPPNNFDIDNTSELYGAPKGTGCKKKTQCSKTNTCLLTRTEIIVLE